MVVSVTHNDAQAPRAHRRIRIHDGETLEEAA